MRRARRTGAVGRAQGVGHRLRSVHKRGGCGAQAPWGGRKASGIGRELGTFGLESFLSPKQITEYVSPDIWDWYAPPPAAATSKL